jgi:uncharacterized protein (TIGR02266 family)
MQARRLAERSERPSAHSTPVPREDRRDHPRYILTLVITMHGENNFYTGLSEDISEGGIFIATQHVLPIGTPVVLSFTLPHSEVPIGVIGTVQWLRGPNATASQHNNFGGDDSAGAVKTGMGVRFDDIGQDSIRAIRDFTRQRTPEFFD